MPLFGHRRSSSNRASDLQYRPQDNAPGDCNPGLPPAASRNAYLASYGRAPSPAYQSSPRSVASPQPPSRGYVPSPRGRAGCDAYYYSHSGPAPPSRPSSRGYESSSRRGAPPPPTSSRNPVASPRGRVGYDTYHYSQTKDVPSTPPPYQGYESSSRRVAPQQLTRSRSRVSSPRGSGGYGTHHHIPTSPSPLTKSSPSSYKQRPDRRETSRVESRPPSTQGRGRSSSCNGRVSSSADDRALFPSKSKDLASRKTTGFPRPMYGSGAAQSSDSLATFRSPHSSASAPLHDAQKNDCYRDTHQARMDKGRKPPLGSQFEAKTRSYHQSDRAANESERFYWGALTDYSRSTRYRLNEEPLVGKPAAPPEWHGGASQSAGQTARLWGDAARGRREMSEAWPGYDSYKDYGRHGKAREFAERRQRRYTGLAEEHGRWSGGR